MRVSISACDSASIILIVSKWRPFSFIFNRGNRKIRWVGDDSHVAFGKKTFPAEKESVRRCVVVLQQLVMLSPKFGEKSSHIFTQSPQIVTVVCRIGCMAWQDEEFFVIESLVPWCQRKLLEVSWLCSASVSPFSVSVSFPYKTHSFFPERLCNHYHGLCRTFSEIWTKFDAVILSDPSRNLIRPNTRLQVEGHRNQHVHPAVWDFVHWLSRYASARIYRCIALIQLL
jgi:hypothetical protein